MLADVIDVILPSPGTMIRAMRRMHGWESDDVKGQDGPWVTEGDVGLVVQAWFVGRRHIRLRLIINDLINVFSCERHNLSVNWSLIKAGETSSGSL